VLATCPAPRRSPFIGYQPVAEVVETQPSEFGFWTAE
jgi:hypothetical protein